MVKKSLNCFGVVSYALVFSCMYWCWSKTNKRTGMSIAVGQKRTEILKWALVLFRMH